MRKPRQKSTDIRKFILENVSAHPKDISALTSNQFRISRPAVLGHIKKLVKDGLLEAEGTTRARRYKLRLLVDEAFPFSLSPDTEEDKVWRHLVRPLLSDIPENVMRICEFGMNEMINNAVDHSEGTEATIHVQQSAADVSFLLQDNGVGIFNRIRRDLRLSEPRQAILELSKGKLTTDPSRHTGEGIFFVSRMFDKFAVFSEGLFFSPNDMSDQEISKLQGSGRGTGVSMGISTRSKRTTQEVFGLYTSEEDDDFAFSRTDVPVSLASFGGDHLVSRSQARRLLDRLQEFQRIGLDFNGVDSIGQAFADEVFRVFARNNPDIEISAMNTNADIDRMIRRVTLGTR
jgi:anti-sigma regulatory factor (Ser/Thr protein kinase)